MVLQLQQQLLAAQAPPLICPPPPPLPTPIPKAAKPEDFNGKSDQLEPFIHQCNLFLELDNYSDRRKITFVLSYMKTGSALTWAEQKMTEYSTAGWTITYAAFLTELRASFGDVSREKTARIKIFKLKQTGSVDDYNVEFVAQHALSGFSDEASLEIWKKGLKNSILCRIYNEATEPTDFATWRLRASHYDRVDRELQARATPHSSTPKTRIIASASGSLKPPPPSSATTSSAPIKVKQECVDPTIAAQHKQKGECILCGSPDHWANVCPQ